MTAVKTPAVDLFLIKSSKRIVSGGSVASSCGRLGLEGLGGELIGRGPAVIWKSQGVDDIPTHRKPCQSRDCERPYHLVAKGKSPLGLWCKGGSKALGALLLLVDVVPQKSFVPVKGLFVTPTGIGELTGQHVGGNHGKGRALSSQQGDAKRGISDKGDATS